ncbi:amidase family protein [Lineolata rhizophorae]|uniref:Amidase family protein n=1 Tax=Lineolata rhizophorae TaxID=578093 RepID=A0A6A6P412_9PEZI|nr:amidase family protein [Lineolata rhizophorae]
MAAPRTSPARSSVSRSILTAFVASLSLLAATAPGSDAVPTDPALKKRADYVHIQDTPSGDALFSLGNTTYLANVQNPKAVLGGDCSAAAGGDLVPLAMVVIDDTTVTADAIQSVLASYAEGDDVYSDDFLAALLVKSGSADSGVSMDGSAVDFFDSIGLEYLFLDTAISCEGSGSFDTMYVDGLADSTLPPGPYAAIVSDESMALGMVYRLYEDTYNTFLYGAYDSNDGETTYMSLGAFYPKYWDPLIPVPSRIYYWDDDRPLAGQRVGIKDLYDIKGLITSGGSQAWAHIVDPAEDHAPSVQQIIDLGGVPVGKQKLAQFASGANPWDWYDEHYPFNPRGDGWLTCSASSSGGGCSIAAYDWLDYAIGSDTGSSMRRPAAVSGTYGQRPSQGMMSLEGVMPLGAATDTAGGKHSPSKLSIYPWQLLTNPESTVFSRDPYKWIKFSKNWYAPELHQSTEITGLPPLVVPDTDAFPKRILYPTDYLPLNNTRDAEPILQAFIDSMAAIFDMTVTEFNFTAFVGNASDPVASNFTTMREATGVINRRTQWEEVAKPLIEEWGARYDGRFPPIDPARRPGWVALLEDETGYSAADYADALVTKAQAVDWYETNLQFSTAESCSESVMLCDIGTGGLPSFRERELNESPDASYLAVTPEGAAVTCASICPIFGCADFTIPIGQVPYQSNVTFHEEMVPVTVNLIVKRGCDFVLYNMIERLADEGVLKTVMTGREAF